MDAHPLRSFECAPDRLVEVKNIDGVFVRLIAIKVPFAAMCYQPTPEKHFSDPSSM
jgi:hypothetical protein